MDGIKQYLKQPEWRRQHRWRKAIWTTMARLGLTGAHALPMNRRWVEIHRRSMPLAGLDPAMAGMKVVQISDLHYSPVVWQRYLVPAGYTGGAVPTSGMPSSGSGSFSSSTGMRSGSGLDTARSSGMSSGLGSGLDSLDKDDLSGGRK